MSDLSPEPVSPGSDRAAPVVMARLIRSEDFERVLRTRTRAKSAHFAVHHVPEPPSRPFGAPASVVPSELSTDAARKGPSPVDDLSAEASFRDSGARWLGAVVPKRHARRAVTRTLLKRQIRSVVAACADSMPAGLWVVRLRAPFDKVQFRSAASEALKRSARDELEHLMRGAGR